jgi:hypothetical protein
VIVIGALALTLHGVQQQFEERLSERRFGNDRRIGPADAQRSRAHQHRKG